MRLPSAIAKGSGVTQPAELVELFAHADPSSEIGLSLAVLKGEVVLRSIRGERVLPAEAFQKDLLTTARQADELITAVRLPVTGGRRAAIREVARRHGDFAIVAVAAVAESSGAVRLGIAGASAKPVVREIASGKDSSAREAVDAMASELDGYEDLHATAAMRRDLLRRLGPLVIDEAVRCAA